MATGHAAPGKPVLIDVDEVYKKYEPKPEEIVTIDVMAYRQSVRVKGKGKDSGRAVASEDAHGQQYEHPSIIGAAVIVANAKRAAGMQHPDAPSASHHKRRKVEEQVQRLHPPPRYDNPVAGPSRLASTTPSNAPALSSSNIIARAGSVKRKSASIKLDDVNDDVQIIGVNASNQARKRQKSASARLSSDFNQSRMSGSTASRSKRVLDIIELSSDGEHKVVVPKKKQRYSTPIEISSDDDDAHPPFPPPTPLTPLGHVNDVPATYQDEPHLDGSSDDEDWGLPGMDLCDPNRWAPIPPQNRYLQDTLTDAFANLDIEPRVPTRFQYLPPNTTKFDAFETTLRGLDLSRESFPWDMLEHCRGLSIPRRPRPFGHLPPSRTFIPPWQQDFALSRLKRLYHGTSSTPLEKAPGCINKVEQKGQWTVSCSGCVGGLADVPDEPPNPHNREGALMAWRCGQRDIPEGHVKRNGENIIKYYAINDIKFDPLRESFVSCGADRKILIWDLLGEDEEDPNNIANTTSRWSKRLLRSIGSDPHDLAFMPGTSILAVGARKVSLYCLSSDVPKPVGVLALFPKGRSHLVGAIAWGSQSTSDYLFASSEPAKEGNFQGFHKAYDIKSKNIVIHFDATEAGDSLCVGPQGDKLALSTRGNNHQPILRLYDVARRNNKAISKTELESYPVRHAGFEGEVNCAAFSPDGILLAVARNDNQTHVYDVRNLHRSPMFIYEHNGECRATLETERYGVVKAQWLQSTRSRRIALVTGGEDGCVRVWDPYLSANDSESGSIVAQVNSDVGHFSIGDPFADEHRLVVGDCSGEVYFFNHNI